MTVADLLTLSLKDIGAVAKRQAPSPDEMDDAFLTANMMLDSWATEKLMIYQTVRSLYNLTAGKQFYTIGEDMSTVAPDFNSVRPIWIQDAGMVFTQANPNYELPIRILTTDEWASLTIKTQASTQAWFLYDDFAYPNSTLELWPVPSVSTLQLVLYVPTPLRQFVNVTDTILCPPGYLEAIRWNLAVRLCPMFGKQLDQVVAAMAGNALTIVQRANKRIETLGIDGALISGGKGIFNYLTGTSTGMRSS